MPPLPSNIRVSVHYAHPSVFAGEEIEATITFSNVSQPSPAPSDRFNEPDWNAPNRVVNSYAGGERSSKPPLSVLRGLPGHVQTSGEQRPALARHGSLNEKRPSGLRHKRSQSLMLNTANNGRTVSGPDVRSPGTVRPAHGRTLSIMSMATDATAPGKGAAVPKRGHNRATSVQVPRRTPSGAGAALTSPRLGVGQPSPLVKTSSPGSPAAPQDEYPFPLTRKNSRSPRQASQTWPSPRGGSRKGSPNTPPQAFVFPPRPTRTDTQSTLSPPNPIPEPDSAVSPMTQRPGPRKHSPQPHERPPEAARQVARLLSDASVSGTPRSSVDIYSHGNNSEETLDSEHIQPSTQRWFNRPELLRGPSALRVTSPRLGPETLMMGYVQVSGSFVVDGSLITQAPFEEVKRKGIVGGQGGGGVVGVDRGSKRNSGLLGAFGWGNITESLNGILGSGEPSSLREMKATASSKAVPLLSTPQSVLFVDLKIAPGESKAYTYSFRLPRGLPPSFRGRAIKISYHLTIGTQRPGGAKEQQHVSSVEVPFRVLGSVNSRGEILGHDLMSPHIILRDQARTSSFDPAVTVTAAPKHLQSLNGQINPSSDDRIPEFQDYITKLLSKPEVDDRDGPPSALLSPTDLPPHHRRSSILDEAPTTQKEAIDLAILRSSQSILTKNSHARSTTRFDIARSGRRVCTISLLRPAYRLGESIHLSIDLSAPEIPTYALCVTLETQEQVDPVLALRSAASVGRVTRRVHANQAENCMFAQRIGVSLAIPWNATPEFVTSGLGMRWRIRVEFIGPRIELRRKVAQGASGNTSAADDEAEHLEAEDREYGKIDGDEEEENDETTGALTKGKALDLKLDFPKLLEEKSRDHRARILGAVEMLQCDSFEVEVPVRVYGAVVGADDGGDVEGLVI